MVGWIRGPLADGRRSRAWVVLLGVVWVLAAAVAPASVSAESVTVRLTDRLEPKELTITPGTTVVWRNDSGNRHRLRSVDHSGDRDWDTGDLEPGERASITFTRPGTYAYVDERDDDDPAFHGTITVRGSTTGGTAGGGAATGGDGADGGGAAPPAANPPADAGGGGAAGTPSRASIGMAGRAFSPRSVTIATGGTVTFRNDDDDEHTATAPEGGWDSGVLGPGASWDRRFPAAGTFAFLCLIHPEMQGTVNVVAADGSDQPAAPAEPAAPAPTPPPVPTASAPTAPPAASPAPSGPSTAAGTVDVAIVDLAFEPATVEVAPGTTLRWTNRGRAPHSATAESGAFDSGILASGATFTTTLDTPGAYAYVCTLHPGMTGSIVVAAGAQPPPGSGGTQGGTASTTEPTATASTPPTLAQAPAAPPTDLDTPGSGSPDGGTAAVVNAERPDVARTASTMDAGLLGRLGLVVLLVGAAMAVFGRVVRGTVRAG